MAIILVSAVFIFMRAKIIASSTSFDIVLRSVFADSIRDILPYCTVRPYIGICNIITGPGLILCPENDSIARFSVGKPLRIYCSGIAELTPELEYSASRIGSSLAGSPGIPSVKGIPFALHRKHSFIACCFPCFDKAGGIVSRALAVFIKNQPVSFRCADGKFHIAFDSNLVAVFK